MVDEEEHDAGREEEEDEHAQRVRDRARPARIDDRRPDEEDERRRDRVAGIEPGPLRIDHVDDEQGPEHVRVRKVHGVEIPVVPMTESADAGAEARATGPARERRLGELT